MKKTYCWLMLLVLAVSVREASAAATNRYVVTNAPGSAWPYDSWDNAATNIKDAVDAANANNAGDIVYVSNGYYRLSAQINVSNCVVTNVNADPALIVIDGNYATTTNRCFYLNHADAAVYGFTITNGYANNANGGGVYINAGNVSHCLITGNRAVPLNAIYTGGGGVYILNGFITDCTISHNTVDSTNANYSGGGGVLTVGGVATVSNCVIAYNRANNTGQGGGILICNSDTVVNNCMIVSNAALGSIKGGGGILNRQSSPDARTPIIQNCTIMGNSATNGAGSGIYFNIGGIARNCVIAHNVAKITHPGYGGGIFLDDGGHVSGCTIVSNQAQRAGGIFMSGGLISNITDCIIYYNVGHFANPNLYSSSGVNYTSVAYSCTAPGSGFAIEGVVTNPPLFVDMATNNYRLTYASPCINAGLNQQWMTNAVDRDGHARIDRFIRRVDMGAYEYVPKGSLFSVR